MRNYKVIEDKVLLAIYGGDTSLWALADKTGADASGIADILNKMSVLGHISRSSSLPSITEKGKRRLFKRYGEDCGVVS